MCFAWQTDILALHVIADACIGVAYFCIPALIIIYVRHRPALWRIAAFFATFIVSCGSTHFADIWTIWHPDYWLSGTLKAVTAIASVATVVSLLPVMPYAPGVRRMLDADRISAELQRQWSLQAETTCILDTIAQIISIRGEDLGIEYLNPQWFAYTGAPQGFGMGWTSRDYIHPDDIPHMEDHVAKLRDPSNTMLQYEVRIRRRDGTYRWFLVRTVALPTMAGAQRRWLSSSTDIDDLKQTQSALAKAAASLEHLAHHDALTKLPNRVRLSEYLDRALSRAHRSNLGVIVMYIDIDKFKTINDTLGHAAGDEVLAQVGTRIAEVLRTGDLACRIGGDEFVLVCTTSAGATHAAHIAQRLLTSLAKPMHVQGTVVTVGASMGISLYPRDGHDVAGLLRKADSAMYAAKEAGRNCYRVYGESAYSPTMEALEFEADLREAIAARQFVVHYQPIVSLDSNQIIGAEALVRWQHPRRGLLAPTEFIKIAEKTDLISQLSYIVVDSACAQIKRVVSNENEPFFISVNASARQFEVPGFADGIASALKQHYVDPARIVVEITESLMMSTVPAVTESFNAIRRLGVKIAIDDFGTGYCSLGYLREYPLDIIKIDRSFVENIAESVTDQAIARAIISLAHTMRMSVIAEGVESAEQLAWLRSLGCDAVQGDLITQPLSSDDYARFVADSPRPLGGHPRLGHSAHIVGEFFPNAGSVSKKQ